MILTQQGFEPLYERQTDREGKTEIEITSKFARKHSKNRDFNYFYINYMIME